MNLVGSKPFRWPYAMRRLVDNVVITKDEAWAVYLVPNQRWRWRGESERAGLVNGEARVWAELGMRGPRWVRRRTTSRPYPVGEWARRLIELSPDALRHGPAPTFNDDLVRQQQWMHTGGVGERTTYAAVQLLTSLPPRRRFTGWLPGQRIPELAGLEEELTWVDEVMAGTGLSARPATIRQMEWLAHRSIGLGLPATENLLAPWDDEQGEWEADDLYALIEGLRVEPCSSGEAVKYSVRRGGQGSEVYVAAVTLGRMGRMEIPDPRGTWLSVPDRLGVPYEAVDTVQVQPGHAVEKTITKHLRKVRAQEAEYREHGLDAPESLARTAAHARRAQDETSYGDEVRATRGEGWYRIAVSGASEDEAVGRANALIREYQSRRISAHLTPAQARVQRECVIGEPVGYTAHRRRMPIVMYAASMPQSASRLGDGRGMVIGALSGSTRLPVCFDSHYSTAFKKGSGLYLFVGRQGAGKSALCTLVCYTDLKRGIPFVYLDPSVTARGLMNLPELEGQLHHVDLTRCPPGLLSPWGAVPDPRRTDFESTSEYEDARSEAAESRTELAVEVAQLVLPPKVATSEDTELLLTRAAIRVGSARTVTYWELIDQLRAEEFVKDLSPEQLRAARGLAEQLESQLLSRRGRVFAPPRGERINYSALDSDALGTIITMGNPKLPEPGAPPTQWDKTERLNVAQLSVAGWLTARVAYGRARTERKTIAIDETQFLEQWSAGRSLFARLHRDTRKWNLCVLKATQNPGDEIRQGVANHVAGVFVGRIEDEEIAADALKLLKVPVGAGYEPVIGGLSQPDPTGKPPPYREYVYRDPDGNVDRFVNDFGWCPQVLEAIQTDAPDPQGEHDRKQDVLGEEWEGPRLPAESELAESEVSA